MLTFVPRLSDYAQLAGAWLLLMWLAGWTLLVLRQRRRGLAPSRTASVAAAIVAMALVTVLSAIHVQRERPGYHQWDLYHTVIGGKFLPELGYEHLYDCSLALAASSERRQPSPKVRDQSTLKVRSSAVGMGAEECARRFTTERLREFQRDAGYFLGPTSSLATTVFLDFGYNGTPFDAFIVRSIFNHASVSSENLYRVSLVDTVLLALALVLVQRAFRWRGLLFTLALIGLNLADHTLAMNASFLRHSYLALMLIGSALLALERPAAAGVAFAVATAERLFPALFVFAYATHAALELARSKHLPREPARFLAAFAAAVAACLLITALAGHGFDAWYDYLQRLARREQALFVSGVGLKPFFLTPPPTPGNVERLLQTFLENASLESSWVYYPVALMILISSGWLLASRLNRHAFTLLFGLISVLTLTSPLPYYMLMLSALGPFCALLDDEADRLRAGVLIAASFALAHTAIVLSRVGHVVVTVVMSPISILLLAGLVVLIVRADRRRSLLRSSPTRIARA